MALAPGTRLGPYEIQALLGTGGMGEVYRAQDTRLDRRVALKVLRSDIARDIDSRQRLEREARAVSRLNHARREGVACAHETADTRALTWCLAGLARMAGARQQPKRAARLWGAAEGLSESIGAPLPSFVRDTAEADLLGVRQALGEEQFAAAWTQGRQLTADAVVAYALQDDSA